MMRTLLAALVVLGTAALAHADGPDPNEIHVQNITYGGTGCPAGTVAGDVADDGQSFTLIFDEFVATIGPGEPLANSRKNCQINVDLHVPQGWSYAISTVDYRGFADLDPKVVGTQKSTYYFQGELAQASATTTFTGPLNQDYVIRDVIPFQDLVWSTCGATRNVNINTQVRLQNTKNRQGSGMLTVDSVDGAVYQIFHLQWKPCP